MTRSEAEKAVNDYFDTSNLGGILVLLESDDITTISIKCSSSRQLMTMLVSTLTSMRKKASDADASAVVELLDEILQMIFEHSGGFDVEPIDKGTGAPN